VVICQGLLHSSSLSFSLCACVLLWAGQSRGPCPALAPGHNRPSCGTVCTLNAFGHYEPSSAVTFKQIEKDKDKSPVHEYCSAGGGAGACTDQACRLASWARAGAGRSSEHRVALWTQPRGSASYLGPQELGGGGV
jgi:hypothetical protein